MPYSTRADIEDIYGPDNVFKWADLDNNEDAAHVEQRIEKAITRANDELHNRLRGGPYLIPFADPVPSAIVYLEALYAGIWLYASRSVGDNDDADQLKGRKVEFLETIRDIHAGRYRLSVEEIPQRYPGVVK